MNIKSLCGESFLCTVTKRSQTTAMAALIKYHASSPLEHVHMDLLGHFIPHKNWKPLHFDHIQLIGQ